MNCMHVPPYTEQEVYEHMRSSLEETVKSNYIELSLLKFEKRSGYWALSICGSNAAKISCKEKIDIIFPDNKKFSVTYVSEIDTFIPKLQSIIQGYIDKIPKEFDCCSCYTKCSDAKHCIHTNLSFAKGCGYRKILNSGRIFYGNGRNV